MQSKDSGSIGSNVDLAAISEFVLAMRDAGATSACVGNVVVEFGPKADSRPQERPLGSRERAELERLRAKVNRLEEIPGFDA